MVMVWFQSVRVMTMVMVMVSSAGVAKILFFFSTQSAPSVLSQLPGSEVNRLLIGDIRGNPE